jgi:hypothetical protein
MANPGSLCHNNGSFFFPSYSFPASGKIAVHLYVQMSKAVNFSGSMVIGLTSEADGYQEANTLAIGLACFLD